MTKKEDAIILLDRTALSYCTRRNQAPLVWQYPPDAARDLEIISKDQLIAQLTKFIDVSKIPPSNCIILLTDAMLFMRDFLPTPPVLPQPAAKGQPPVPVPKPLNATEEAAKREDDIKHFLDTVPFENVASKNYPVGKGGTRVVAANRDFYEAVEKVFEEKGSTMSAVVPAFLIWKPNTPVALSAGVVSQLFGRMEFLKQQGLSLHYVEVLPQAVAEKQFSMDLKAKSKPRTFALVGVFVVLLSVFGFMLMSYLKPSTTVNSNANIKPNPALSSPTLTITVPPTIPATPSTSPVSSPSAALNKAAIKIQINTSSASAAQRSLRQSLVDQGFTDITSGTQTSSGTAKTLIIFNTTLPTEARDAIFQIVQKQFPSISQQQNSQLQSDALINLP